MFDPFSCILLIHGITWIAKVISSSFQMVFVVHLVTLHRVLPICSPSSWNMVCWRQWAAFLRLGAPIHGLFQCLLGEVNLWHISLKFIPWWRYQDFFSLKNPMPWFGGMVDPSPTNYFQQKKSLKMSGLDPLKNQTWSVTSAFLFWRIKLCWNVSLRFDKRITQSFFQDHSIFFGGQGNNKLGLVFSKCIIYKKIVVQK